MGRIRASFAVFVLAAALAFAGCSSPSPDPSTQAPTPVTTAAPPPLPVPASTRLIIAPDLPPLPPGAENAVQPFEVVRAAYEFAARHPEVLKFMPCFCGCERGGHKHNRDCFIASADGAKIEWETHALGCEICLDVATTALRMHNSGASIATIRDTIERKYASLPPGHGHTPTPAPPRGGTPDR